MTNVLINKSSLIALLKNHPSIKWNECINESDSETCNWTHIFTYNCTSTGLLHSYGLTESGVWCPLRGDNNIRSHFLFGFYVLLESSRKEISQLLKSSIEELNLPEILIFTFPFDSIVESALTDSGYWLLLANSWLDDGYPINSKIAELAPNNNSVLAWKRERIKNLFYV